MRISDWSSYVCSSDLTGAGHHCRTASRAAAAIAQPFPLVASSLRHSLHCRPDLFALYFLDRGRRRKLRVQATRAHLAGRRSWPGLSREALRLMRRRGRAERSEEHTSELQSLMRISYAVFCLKKKNKIYS